MALRRKRFDLLGDATEEKSMASRSPATEKPG